MCLLAPASPTTVWMMSMVVTPPYLMAIDPTLLVIWLTGALAIVGAETAWMGAGMGDCLISGIAGVVTGMETEGIWVRYMSAVLWGLWCWSAVILVLTLIRIQRRAWGKKDEDMRRRYISFAQKWSTGSRHGLRS